MKRNSQSGVALVITLILLAVITFMAVSFLVIERQQAKSTKSLIDMVNANNAAEHALQMAIAQAGGTMLATTNGYNFVMLVSTNIDIPFLTNGLTPNIATNCYFDPAGNLLAGNALLQNLANLQILPRAPVFVPTTVNIGGVLKPTNEFRYYLDLNRNGRFEPTGLVSATNEVDRPVIDPNTLLPVFTRVTGDPQWVGVLEHPDQPHSSSNKFIARYCFIALPIGNSLDMNFIGNQSKFSKATNQLFDGGFFRNQGVGTWELNLAGFLANLNPNVWNPAAQPANVYDYQYSSMNVGSRGVAFDDAAAILQVKFNNSYNNLNTFAQMYPALSSQSAVSTNNIDEYAYGPLMIGFFPARPVVTPFNSPNLRWSGSDNPNAFFTPQDPFNLVPIPAVGGSFPDRLQTAGLTRAQGGPSLSTFDQYTYYRMLQQMSFDSAPESARPVAQALAMDNNGILSASPVSATPLNLNYVNLNGISETNFILWTNATMFFTNCADRLIRQEFPNPVVYYANGVTNVVSLCISNIPLYPVNFYTPAMHRLLQLAANIYDAQHVNPNRGEPDYPTVFRPIFSRSGGQTGTNIFVSGYAEEPAPTTLAPGQSPSASQYSIPLSLPENLYTAPAAGYQGAAFAIPNYPATTRPIHVGSGPPTDIVNLYSAPWIIGAKKGFPNFNQFSMESIVQITRKLQVDKIAVGKPRANWLTNQMYIIGISNILGAESWNSYSNDYTRGLQMSVIDMLSMTVYNDQGIRISTNITSARSYPPSGPPGFAPWHGFRAPLTPGSNPGKNAASFLVPLLTNVVMLPDSIWRELSGTILPVAQNPNLQNRFEPLGTFPLPRFGLNVTNRFRYWMTDGPTGRIIDYVHFDGVGRNDDLLADTLAATNTTAVFQKPTVIDSMWDTNRPTGTILATAPTYGIINQISVSMGQPTLTNSDWTGSQLPGANSMSETAGFNTFISSGPATDATNLVRQAPYTATRKFGISFSLQANDPLVHYTPGDLGITNMFVAIRASELTNIVMTNFGSLSTRYAPFLQFRGAGNTADLNLAIKDPFIRCSDDWQFPENPFPNIGWLGRVHRGTPWQTVYLKSQLAGMSDWVNFSGHTNPYVATLTHPMNDWKILDLFTTAPNENATRGQLSINNTNEAAWHAVLDGVVVLTNTSQTNVNSIVLDPNAHAAALAAMILGQNGINGTRNQFPGSLSTSPQNYVNVISNHVLLFPQPRNSNYVNYVFGTNIYSGTFTSLGQILATPLLTVASPFVNPAGTYGPGLFNSTSVGLPLISDAVYERIPQSIMSLVRVGSPRYVIFAYGQSLKPADRSIYQGGGPFFGMPTNYGIAGETVTRTVVDFANQIAPVNQAVAVFPPVANLTTNYVGIALLPAQPPPKAMVRAHTPVPPQ